MKQKFDHAQYKRQRREDDEYYEKDLETNRKSYAKRKDSIKIKFNQMTSDEKRTKREGSRLRTMECRKRQKEAKIKKQEMIEIR